MLQEKGDIAFLNEKSVFEYVNNTNDFELLCPLKEADQAYTLSSSFRNNPNQQNVVSLNEPCDIIAMDQSSSFTYYCHSQW